MPDTIRIAAVDDHPLVRGGLERALQRVKDIKLIAVGKDAADACRIVEETPEHAALWLPRGSLAMLPFDDTGSRIRIPGESWELEPISSKRDALCIGRAGRPHDGVDHVGVAAPSSWSIRPSTVRRPRWASSKRRTSRSSDHG